MLKQMRDAHFERGNEMSKPIYCSYVLRVWQDGHALRISLTDTSNRMQHNFVSLERLVEFLHTQTGSNQPLNHGDNTR
jgi:hypothetical protein